MRYRVTATSREHHERSGDRQPAAFMPGHVPGSRGGGGSGSSASHPPDRARCDSGRSRRSRRPG